MKPFQVSYISISLRASTSNALLGM